MELGVPIPMAGPFGRLAVALETVAQFSQQVSHRLPANSITLGG